MSKIDKLELKMLKKSLRDYSDELKRMWFVRKESIEVLKVIDYLDTVGKEN